MTRESKLLEQVGKEAQLMANKLRKLKAKVKDAAPELRLPQGRYGNPGALVERRLLFLIYELDGLHADSREEVLALPPAPTPEEPK